MTGLGSEMPWLSADETFDPLAHADVDKHLTENVEGTKQVTRSRLLTPIAVTRASRSRRRYSPLSSSKAKRRPTVTNSNTSMS
jgi:hypothetical protein